MICGLSYKQVSGWSLGPVLSDNRSNGPAELSRPYRPLWLIVPSPRALPARWAGFVGDFGKFGQNPGGAQDLAYPSRGSFGIPWYNPAPRSPERSPALQLTRRRPGSRGGSTSGASRCFPGRKRGPDAPSLPQRGRKAPRSPSPRGR
jgi:hypothetical protein